MQHSHVRPLLERMKIHTLFETTSFCGARHTKSAHKTTQQGRLCAIANITRGHPIVCLRLRTHRAHSCCSNTAIRTMRLRGSVDRRPSLCPLCQSAPCRHQANRRAKSRCASAGLSSWALESPASLPQVYYSSKAVTSRCWKRCGPTTCRHCWFLFCLPFSFCARDLLSTAVDFRGGTITHTSTPHCAVWSLLFAA
jgi:hypothetical protein